MIAARSLVATALALSGLGLVIHGLWMPAKAQLAQVLLVAAWAQSAPGEEKRPWPWADTWPVLRLRVPELDVDQVVLEGASGAVLAFAPGRDASPSPDHTVIGGHRDTHFAFLRDLSVGRHLDLESPDGHTETYRVEWTAVVDHRDLDVLESDGEAPALTLVTCWPFDSPAAGGPLRFVVRAVAADQGERGSTRTGSPSA